MSERNPTAGYMLQASRPRAFTPTQNSAYASVNTFNPDTHPGTVYHIDGPNPYTDGHARNVATHTFETVNAADATSGGAYPAGGHSYDSIHDTAEGLNNVGSGIHGPSGTTAASTSTHTMTPPAQTLPK